MTFWRSYAHLIWATKNREPYILPDLEADIYAYLVSKAAEMDCYVHAIDGLEDHVHLIISIPPKHSVAWVVKTLKGSSSHFVNHTLRPEGFVFKWQRGYGYLTLGESQCERAIAYVEQQKQRHRQRETNTWLERCPVDEDSIHRGVPLGDSTSIRLREAQARYSTSDLIPF